MEWGKIGPNFLKLKAMFEALLVEHEKLNNNVVKDFKTIGGRASLVDNKILLLKEHIGHPPMASEAGIKTM